MAKRTKSWEEECRVSTCRGFLRYKRPPIVIHVNGRVPKDKKARAAFIKMIQKAEVMFLSKAVKTRFIEFKER